MRLDGAVKPRRNPCVEGTKTSYPYTWMQDEEEVVLIANVPGDVKELNLVKIRSRAEQNRFIDRMKSSESSSRRRRALFQDIGLSDSSWSLVKRKDGTKNLEVTLVKAESYDGCVLL